MLPIKTLSSSSLAASSLCAAFTLLGSIRIEDTDTQVPQSTWYETHYIFKASALPFVTKMNCWTLKSRSLWTVIIRVFAEVNHRS